jgi:ABC-type transport system involved in cytochrome bd biosynthesis fused ATPase/permease subunit
MKHYFYLNCFYKYDGHINFDKDSKLEKMAKKYGGKESGTGSDFKTRDVNFTFETFNRAKRFYLHARKRRLLDGAEIAIVGKNGDGSAFANIKEFLG